jgi:hypothetical protein
MPAAARHRRAAATRCAQQGAGAASSPDTYWHLRRAASRTTVPETEAGAHPRKPGHPFRASTRCA